MRIMLSQRTDYLPARGGATRTNLMLVEELARRGHQCRIVAPGRSAGSVPTTVRLNGVTVHLVPDRRDLVAQLASDIKSFAPDVILISSEDLGQALLRTAIAADVAPTVYLGHTVQALPVGPAAFFPSESGACLLRRTAGVVAMSGYLQRYLHRWAGLDSIVFHPPVYTDWSGATGGAGPDAFVTMVNPCEVKGIGILLRLADDMPHVPFAAVPGWGTLDRDRGRLRRRRNITLLPPYDDVDEILGRTRIMLVPSLWPETFGYIAIEAMLRGVPVIASRVGGLPEAMLGVDHCLPVNMIEEYSDEVDETMTPVPCVPEQDVERWRRVCETLLTDPESYAMISARARAASRAFVDTLSWEPMASLLDTMTGAVGQGSDGLRRGAGGIDDAGLGDTGRAGRLNIVG